MRSPERAGARLSSNGRAVPTQPPPPAVARLHAALDGLALQARDAATVSASLRSAARAGLAPESAPEAGADRALTASFAALLADLAPPAHCAPADLSLPPSWGDLGEGGGGASAAPSPILLAAALRDAAHLLPHWTAQALALAAAAPPGRAFVSLYESGSADASPAWLGLAGRIFAAAGVPATVVARGAGEARAPGTPRIAHLASLRNRALAPLLCAEAAAAGVAAAAGGGSTPNASHYLWSGLSEAGYAALGGTPAAAAAGRGEVGKLGSMQAAGFPAARVLFINDVFFCAADGVRLLRSGAAARAAIACGLDLYPDAPPGAVFGGRRVAPGGRGAWSAAAALLTPFSRGRWASWPSAEIRPHGPRGPTLSSAEQQRPHDSLLFYDAWVARDAAGLPFLGGPPFLTHPYSRLRLEAGLPFPASCCWNGMASLDAAPFLEGGYRFRAVAATGASGVEAELAAVAGVVETGAAAGAPPFACPASECSLLCEDWTRAGAAPRIIIDPGVRLAYDAGVAADAVGRGGGSGGGRGHGVGLPTIPLLPFSALSSAPPVDFAYAPRKFSMTCCPAGVGGDEVVHWEQCGAGAGLDRECGGGG